MPFTEDAPDSWTTEETALFDKVSETESAITEEIEKVLNANRT